MSPLTNMAINKEYGQQGGYTRTLAWIAWTVRQFTYKAIGHQRKERTEDIMRPDQMHLFTE